MGTSGSRTGGYSESGSEWTEARREMTSLLRGSGGTVPTAVGAFARAASTPVARAGLAGGVLDATVRTAQRLGEFLSQVRSSGVTVAGQGEGLPPLEQLSPADALFAVAEAFGALDGSLASSVSYSALSNTIQDLLDDDAAANSAELFDWLASEDGMRRLFETFIANTVECLLLSELGDRFENAETSPSETSATLKEIHEYVQAHIAFSLNGVDVAAFDWTGPEGESLIRGSLDAALATMRSI